METPAAEAMGITTDEASTDEASSFEQVSLQELLQRSDALDDYVVYLCVEPRLLRGGKSSAHPILPSGC